MTVQRVKVVRSGGGKGVGWKVKLYIAAAVAIGLIVSLLILNLIIILLILCAGISVAAVAYGVVRRFWARRRRNEASDPLHHV